MRRKISYSFDALEQEIRRLEDELYRARSAITRLAPVHLHKILESYSGVGSRSAAHAWVSEAVEELIAEAKPLTDEEGASLFEDRASCPLCRDESTSYYVRGFSLPEGLRRHLTGWGSHVRQCDVMAAVMALAHDRWDHRFGAAEAAEEKKRSAEIERRRKCETLYQTAPDGDALLIDERIGYGTVARTEAELAWAEQRPRELKFEVVQEAKVTRYTSDRGDFIVYADPRANGEIRFVAYKKSLTKRSHVARLRLHLASLYIKDAWRNDVCGKYEARLAKAVRTKS